MLKEPAFMRELHEKQEKEYKKTKKLNLHEFVKHINNRAERALKDWGLEEKSFAGKMSRIVLAK